MSAPLRDPQWSSAFTYSRYRREIKILGKNAFQCGDPTMGGAELPGTLPDIDKICWKEMLYYSDHLVSFNEVGCPRSGTVEGRRGNLKGASPSPVERFEEQRENFAKMPWAARASLNIIRVYKLDTLVVTHRKPIHDDPLTRYQAYHKTGADFLACQWDLIWCSVIIECFLRWDIIVWS